MRVFLAIWLLAPLMSLANEGRIAVGMNKEAAIALIKEHGGKDITGGLAVVGPKGEWPLSGIYWSFEEYDAVIALDGNAKLAAISYWTKKDFGESKVQRSRSEQRVRGITFNRTRKTVSVEAKKL